MKGILGYSEDVVVSSDFIEDTRSGMVTRLATPIVSSTSSHIYTTPKDVLRNNKYFLILSFLFFVPFTYFLLSYHIGMPCLRASTSSSQILHSSSLFHSLHLKPCWDSIRLCSDFDINSWWKICAHHSFCPSHSRLSRATITGHCTSSTQTRVSTNRNWLLLTIYW